MACHLKSDIEHEMHELFLKRPKIKRVVRLNRYVYMILYSYHPLRDLVRWIVNVVVVCFPPGKVMVSQ